MRTTDKIGFKLTIREPDTDERTVVVCPRYDNLKLKWSRPSGKMYYQKELSGTIRFWGVDFNTVYGCALRTKFVLAVYDLRRGVIARCEFRKTDCKWDINHGTCDVDVSSWNPYKKIEAGKDNEYNLVKLGIYKRLLNLFVYPTRQVYFLTDKEMHYYRSDATSTKVTVAEQTSMRSLIDDMYFGGMVNDDATSLRMVGVVNIQSSPWSGYDQYYGVYYSTSNTFTAVSGETRAYEQWLYKNGDTSSTHKVRIYVHTYLNGNCAFRIDFFDGSTMLAKTGINSFTEFDNSTWGNNYVQTARATNLGLFFNNGNIAFTGQGRFYFPLSRIASACEIGDAPSGSNLIKSNDILFSGPGIGNYKTVHSLPNTALAFSTRTSETPTEYGPVENTNYYYDKPTDEDIWTPVYKESWFGGYSLWLADNSLGDFDINAYKAEAAVNDFYTLGDAIKAVLHEIDPDLHFESDTAHSQFLFSGTNPVGGAQQGMLYISQKSNVLNLGYDYPAWKAPITWGRIETLLNNAFNCYWEIYEVNGVRHLRIEHRTYFENGGTYNGSSLAETIDLRSIFRTANRTRLSDKTNRWEWDKEGGSVSSNANRYEYGWMDTQSAIFDGETIVVPESHQLFEDERVDERKVDWFSTDIDFLTSVQAECSSDGFVLVMESLSGNGWIIGGHPNYTGQNYQLSLEYLQPLYLLAGIYSSVVSIGDTEYPNQFTSRMRKSEIEFNLPEGVSIEAGDMLWTEVGKGVTETLEQDISSDKWTATVRYENE